MISFYSTNQKGKEQTQRLADTSLRLFSVNVPAEAIAFFLASYISSKLFRYAQKSCFLSFIALGRSSKG